MKRYFYLILFSGEDCTREIKIPSAYLKIAFLALALLVVLSLSGLFFLGTTYKLKKELAHLQKRLACLENENLELRNQVAALKREKQELLAGAVGELRARSEVIEKLVSDLGLKHYLPKMRKSYRGGPYKSDEFSSAEGGIYVPLETHRTLSGEKWLEDYENLIATVDAYLGVLAQVPIGRPCRGYISSGFGRRKDPFTGKPAFHTGIDLVSYPGTPVKSTADGKVIYAGRHSGYGKVVVIRHGYGYSTLYGHLKKITVRAGQKVKRGQIIGYLGNTGRSTGPHLHYEVRRYGRYLNPYRYMRIRFSRK